MAITGFVPNEVLNPQPRWMPNHPDTLWCTFLSQEVRVIGITESASVLQYQCRIVNSTDNRVYIANESQLKEMSEAKTYDSTPKINKAPWAAIKDVLLKFMASYPVDPKLREQLEAQVKSRNKGIATAIIEERQTPTGNFMGAADLSNRMKQRNEQFPWDAIGDLFDYSA